MMGGLPSRPARNYPETKERIVKDLVDLSLSIQVLLVAGYIGCRINLSGTYSTHKDIDIIFQTLVFGVCANFITLYIFDLAITQKYMNKLGISASRDYVSGAFVLIVAISIAVAWKIRARDLCVKVLNKSRITHENFYPTSLHHIIFGNKINNWMYLSVICKDGSVIESAFGNIPKELPFYPCDIDADGNIAVYATYYTRPDGTEVDLGETRFRNALGYPQITYIPSSEISRFDLSFEPKRTTS